MRKIVKQKIGTQLKRKEDLQWNESIVATSLHEENVEKRPVDVDSLVLFFITQKNSVFINSFMQYPLKQTEVLFCWKIERRGAVYYESVKELAFETSDMTYESERKINPTKYFLTQLVSRLFESLSKHEQSKMSTKLFFFMNNKVTVNFVSMHYE